MPTIELFENFQLLLRIKPNHNVLPFVKQDMFRVWNYKEFHIMMIYILDFINPEWRSGFSFPINEYVCSTFPKEHEINFKKLICENLNNLRQEFPDEGMPHITQSSLTVFFGKKARNYLTKTSGALLSLYIKRGKTSFGLLLDENVHDCCVKLEKEIQVLREDIDHKLSDLQEEFDAAKIVLERTVQEGCWSCDMREKLLDFDNVQVFHDWHIQCEEKMAVFKPLEDKLQQINGEFELGQSQQLVDYDVQFPEISSDCLWRVSEDTIERHVSRLKGNETDWLYQKQDISEQPYTSLVEWVQEQVQLASEGCAGSQREQGCLVSSPATPEECKPGQSTSFERANTLSLTPILNEQEKQRPKEEVKVEMATLAALLRPTVANVLSTPLMKYEFSTKRKPRLSVNSAVKKLQQMTTPRRRADVSSTFQSTTKVKKPEALFKSEMSERGCSFRNLRMQESAPPQWSAGASKSPPLLQESLDANSLACLDSSALLDEEVRNMIRAECSGEFSDTFESDASACFGTPSEKFVSGVERLVASPASGDRVMPKLKFRNRIFEEACQADEDLFSCTPPRGLLTGDDE